MSNNINSKVKTATKWSAITEIAAKLVAPISTMVLARLLTPEAFGVLVTATMVISFAEIFTDAGFQKYLVQKEFETEEKLRQSTAVAFWSNLFMSLAVWIGIVIFAPQIASLVGNEGYGLVIAISCICIPLEAFSSIQMALFKRKLDFKTLFIVRIIGVMIPLVITIPLAFITRSYWSLIIGMIALNLSNAIILTWKSDWKPRWFYDWSLFKEMFSFTAWSMLEAISIWLTSYLDIFIVGTILSTYYMGVYRTSITTVGQIMAIITSATTPVLFSALSRLQDNDEEFKKLFFRFQKLVGLLVIPLGFGIFLFSDLLTSILLGSQWTEASNLIGWWGLTSAVTIVFAHYCSEIYRSLGKPRLSVYVQVSHIVVMIPTVLISIKYGFETLSIARSLVRLELILVNFIFTYYLTRISPLSMLKNVAASLLASVAMALVVWIVPSVESIYMQVGLVVMCTITYIVIVCAFREERNILFNLKNYIKSK